MSTVCAIGIQTKTGKVKAISLVDGDGSYDTVAPILRKFYNTKEKVEELIKLGNISYLGQEIGHKHDPECPEDNFCIALRRDKAARCATAARNFENAEDYFEHHYNDVAEFVFLFVDGRWKYKPIDFDTDPRSRWKDVVETKPLFSYSKLETTN